MEIYRPSSEAQESLTGNLKELYHQTQQLGLSLPDAFLHFMASPELQERIPSCTACYFELPEKILPCPGSQDGYIISFLRDQQDCLIWYLYLTPSNEHCVLISDSGLAWLADPEQASEISHPVRILQATVVGAPSFEEFIYRFWLENTLWFKLHEHDGAFTEEEKRYIEHYAAKPEEN